MQENDYNEENQFCKKEAKNMADMLLANKKATMIIITTGELNCCGGGWLSRGFRFWWQILFDT